MRTTWHYDLLGVSVHSELRLSADESLPPGPAESCNVALGAEPNWGAFRDGRLVAQLGDDASGYEVRRTNTALVARFGDMASLSIDAERKQMRAFGDAEALGYIVPNAGLALYLLDAPGCLLHASAVEWRGWAHAVLGETRAGKTTVAALLCGAGARLVTDDTLRVDTESTVTCRGGTRRLRLRPSAADVTQCLAASDRTRSADGRVVVDVPAAASTALPLGSLCFPQLDDSANRPELRPLSPKAALERLTGCTRIRGLSEQSLLSSQFRTLAHVARSVRAFEARLPYGPPFVCAWGSDLLTGLEASTAR